MSAAVLCGNKRSFVEELLPPPNLAKRFRCSTSATITFCAPYLLEHLRSIFPLMDADILLRTLEECGYNVDVAIDMLQQLHLGSPPEKNPIFAEESDDNAAKSEPELAPPENHSAPSNLPKNCAEWVDLFVKEMMSSSSVDDAKGRAAKVLEVFEKFVSGRAGEEATQSVKEENMELKQKVEGVVKVNTVLKQAVMILYTRQKEYQDRKQEFEDLKLLVSQYQEQVKALEVNNYALTLHLKQAQQTSCIPASFHPHVF